VGPRAGLNAVVKRILVNGIRVSYSEAARFESRSELWKRLFYSVLSTEYQHSIRK
jgi:hypothetical protein